MVITRPSPRPRAHLLISTSCPASSSASASSIYEDRTAYDRALWREEGRDPCPHKSTRCAKAAYSNILLARNCSLSSHRASRRDVASMAWRITHTLATLDFPTGDGHPPRLPGGRGRRHGRLKTRRRALRLQGRAARQERQLGRGGRRVCRERQGLDRPRPVHTTPTTTSPLLCSYPLNRRASFGPLGGQAARCHESHRNPIEKLFIVFLF